LTGLVERRRLARRANFGFRAKKGGGRAVFSKMAVQRQRLISCPHPDTESGFTLFEVAVSALT